MKYFLFITLLVFAGTANAQRIIMPLNEGWEFTKDNYSFNNNKALQWKNISLPHTWNTTDVMDDEPGYYRGVGWYVKKITLPENFKEKEIYLFFEGANQQVTVYVNGEKAGEHLGGYTGFFIPVTAFVHPGIENSIAVKVDNSFNKNIPPLTADFTFYGGIYRQVSLVATAPVHFSTNDKGSNAVYISTPVVNNNAASAEIKAIIRNDGHTAKKIKISTNIYNAAGKLIQGNAAVLWCSAGADTTFIQHCKPVIHPALWSPADPYLYKAVTKIADAVTGKVLDEITNPLGFRWFSFDAEKGFFLNGRSLKLIGASRHQDFEGLGNALPFSFAKKDAMLLKEMGGNFLRVAHYPQAQALLQACDELGILASVEIPVVNEITETDSFYNNCENMQAEMIRQNFNHPSVITWCYMNEVLLRPHFNNDKEKQQQYFLHIKQLAKKLDSISRKEDGSRYTMMANHGDYKRYHDAGLLDIPMIVGWNLYQGWYGGTVKDFPLFLDRFHKDYPAKPVLVTEYGADADPRISSDEPVRFDKSVEYATAFHQAYLPEILKRPFVAGAAVWNLADFNSETRAETMPHINNKGLLDWGRKPKAPYYYYKAILSKKPFVKILGPALRGGIADAATGKINKAIRVASNVSQVELFVNDKPTGQRKIVNGIAEWEVSFANGLNKISTKAKQNGKIFTDSLLIDIDAINYRLQKSTTFKQLNLLLGAKRYFIDSSNNLWLPAQEYKENNWGYIGGKAYAMPGNNRLPYGTDINIRNTVDDPIYQTQQTGIEAVRLDVPDGDYSLTFYFAELQGEAAAALAYNLDTATVKAGNGERVFDIMINDEKEITGLNIAKQYGRANAVKRTVNIRVKNNAGIAVKFIPVYGEPVLNALQVKKIN